MNEKKMANIFYFDFADADLNNGYYCFANLFFCKGLSLFHS